MNFLSAASELELTRNISREEDFLSQPTILSSAQNQVPMEWNLISYIYQMFYVSSYMC